jgi:hypothetical protein
VRRESRTVFTLVWVNVIFRSFHVGIAWLIVLAMTLMGENMASDGGGFLILLGVASVIYIGQGALWGFLRALGARVDIPEPSEDLESKIERRVRDGDSVVASLSKTVPGVKTKEGDIFLGGPVTREFRYRNGEDES